MSGLVLTLMLTATAPIPDGARQMVLVIAPDDRSIDGTLRRYERTSPDAPWTPVGAPTPIILGPAGLASGSGLHEGALPGLPSKNEGDGKSPAGVFRLTSAFGFAASPDTHMPYTLLEGPTECVDDPDSSFYNQIVSRDAIDEPDWVSSERMRSISEYVLGIVVDHNPDKTPGGGSCIFLHVWSRPGEPTAGCTAMGRSAMEAIASWLDPDAKPVLVQLTRELMDELASAWHLPPRVRETE